MPTTCSLPMLGLESMTWSAFMSCSMTVMKDHVSKSVSWGLEVENSPTKLNFSRTSLYIESSTQTSLSTAKHWIFAYLQAKT